ncbi:MAG TPA: hypothetical protein PKA00_22175 [Saprospiraceae bacterium]|nr:hypothetical protein [Saprospiraceae bacterium]HMQ85636.1 hypothetical protein [Saprospiraceae bacterium]
MEIQALAEKKNQWRRLLLEDIGQAIKALLEDYPEYAPKHNDLLQLKGRLNAINNDRINGIVNQEELERRYNSLRRDLLVFVDELAPRDFEMPMGTALPQKKNGQLLHKIPRQMRLEEETRCIIRLAYDAQHIVQDITLSAEVEIQEITVSEIMHAAIIDPNEVPAFSIRSFSDEEQFLETDTYTEWLFWVKPLRTGTFPLMLKISVVEMIHGQERKRNLIWEEQVKIVTEEQILAEPDFQALGVQVQQQMAPPPMPQPPAPAPAISESKVLFPATYPPETSNSKPPASRRKRDRLRWLSIAASLAIAVGAAWWALGLQQDKQWVAIKDNPSPSVSELEQFVEESDNSEHKEAAQTMIKNIVDTYPQRIAGRWEVTHAIGVYPDGQQDSVSYNSIVGTIYAFDGKNMLSVEVAENTLLYNIYTIQREQIKIQASDNTDSSALFKGKILELNEQRLIMELNYSLVSEDQPPIRLFFNRL